MNPTSLSGRLCPQTRTILNDDTASVTFESDLALEEGSGPSPIRDFTFFFALDSAVHCGFDLYCSVTNLTTDAGDLDGADRSAGSGLRSRASQTTYPRP